MPKFWVEKKLTMTFEGVVEAEDRPDAIAIAEFDSTYKGKLLLQDKRVEIRAYPQDEDLESALGIEYNLPPK